MDFQPWAKTPRFNRDITITEKIDGSNAAIVIEEPRAVAYRDDTARTLGITAQVATNEGNVLVGAQSRKRLIVPGDDNFGFAAWVAKHADDLVRALGPGRHFGEWWGSGIQRGYGLTKGEKRFSLFNVHRYAGIAGVFAELDVVPTLWQGPLRDFDQDMIDLGLRTEGSQAAPGYMNPEGFIIFHSASQQVYKVLLEGDDTHKGA